MYLNIFFFCLLVYVNMEDRVVIWKKRGWLNRGGGWFNCGFLKSLWGWGGCWDDGWDDK